MDKVISNIYQIRTSAPQGTVLGPILFNILFNGLFSEKHKGNILGYADDITIFNEANTWTELNEIVESDFRLIAEWLKYM